MTTVAEKVTTSARKPKLAAVNAFGKCMRQLRTELAITMTTQAEQLGVTKAYLSRIESGDKALTGQAVEAIIAGMDGHLSHEQVERLRVAAAVAMDSLPTHRLNKAQRQLVARFVSCLASGERVPALVADWIETTSRVAPEATDMDYSQATAVTAAPPDDQ